MTEDLRHPVFARLYYRLSVHVETKGAGEHRDELLDGLTGRVIEVGAGSGLNFSHYPDTVTEVLAVEPEPYLRAKAIEAAATAPVPMRVVPGTADALPADNAEFDAGVASLVLCSVHDAAAALEELRRVIRPGGELRFYEHIQSATPRLAGFQRVVDLVWPHLAGGCHTSRTTVAAIGSAGFAVEHRRDFAFLPAGRIGIAVSPHVIGRARRP